jgi:hypothetical protein
MPDPVVVYVVTSVVVLGLVVWVIAVLSRPDKGQSPPEKPAAPPAASAPPSSANAPPSSASAPKSSSERSRRLDSHAEIRDEPQGER